MPSASLTPFHWPKPWTDPSLLKLLEGGPVNCLIAEPGASASPLAEAARKSGLTVLDSASLSPAPLAKTKWDSGAPQIVLTDLVWPRMKMSPKGRPDDAEAGPTGAPWIDSNCWVARLAAARAPGKTVWLGFEPDEKEQPPDEAAYILAIADSAAAGARWIVSLDANLVRGLPAGDAEALKKWRSIQAALSFFEARRDWAAWQPWGPVGILSSFAGEDEYMGQEMLNLSARRNLLYRILDRSVPASHNLEGLRAVIYVDNSAPTAALKSKLIAFAQAGGLLIVPRSLAAQFPAGKVLQCPVAGYKLQTFGKGMLAAATQDWDDPYFLAADVHSLVSRRNDPVRLFNGRSLWMHYAVAPDGGGALLQFVSFSSRANQTVSLAPARQWRSAVMHTLGEAKPSPLPPVEVDGHVEFQLPRFTYYAALEFRS